MAAFVNWKIYMVTRAKLFVYILPAQDGTPDKSCATADWMIQV